jgi:(2Fe-2S) ferredoxin
LDIPDAVVFCLSQQHLNARRERELALRLQTACALPSLVVRLEGTEANLETALTDLACRNYKDILVQPVGLPFSQSLAAWLPGVIAHWRDTHKRHDVSLRLGDAAAMDAGLQAAIDQMLDAENFVYIDKQKPSLGKPGWDNPPPFKHHILVCTGPRCHYHGASDLKAALDDELNKAGVKQDCLIATTGCLYPCNKGPLLALYPRGEWYSLPDKSAVSRFVKKVIAEGSTASDLKILNVEQNFPNPKPSKQGESV